MRRNIQLAPALTIFAVLALSALGPFAVRSSNSFAATSDEFHSAISRPESVSPSRAVVLELFTSEGCSSCPPVEAFLKNLDDLGRVDGIEMIAIEEHVDYWDHLGWKDPFSSHDWTERQEQYSHSFRHDGIYTPQLIVNGLRELVPKSANVVRETISEAAKAPGANLQLSVTGASQKAADFSITLSNIPAEVHSAELWLAVTERNLASNVLRGENQGRNLAHAAVLRKLTRVKFKPSDPANSGEVKTSEVKTSVALDPSWKRENLRFVVFLQEPKTLHIFGAAASSLSR